MAGHDLLPGCTTPWKHDECPGYRRASAPGGFDGMVCHCPCHGLKRRIAKLEEHIGQLTGAEMDSGAIGLWQMMPAPAPPDMDHLLAALPSWLDRIAPSIPEFVAWCVVQDWPDE